jgi:hypothetical protein
VERVIEMDMEQNIKRNRVSKEVEEVKMQIEVLM